MRTRSYFESMIHDDDSYHNEVYTNRIKGLKNNARAAVVLKHQSLQQSFLLADVVGATVAGLAMCLAVGGLYLCYRFSRHEACLPLSFKYVCMWTLSLLFCVLLLELMLRLQSYTRHTGHTE